MGMIDFYNLVNKNFIKQNPIPKFTTSYGTFHKMQIENYNKVHDIILDLIRDKNKCNDYSSKYEFYINQLLNYYQSMYNYKPSRIDHDKISSIFTEIKNNVGSTPDNSQSFELFVKYCYFISFYGVNTPINVSFNIDFKQNKRTLLVLQDGGISLPNKEYYLDLELGAELKKIMADYNIQYCDDIIKIEKEISFSMLPENDKHDPTKIYNLYNRDNLFKIYPTVNWDSIISHFFMGDPIDVWIESAKYIFDLTKIFKKYRWEVWLEYFRWRVVFHFFKYIEPCKYFLIFGKKMLGVESKRPNYLTHVENCTEYYGYLLGHIFIESNQVISNKLKKLLQSIINNIKHAFMQRLENLEWMQTETRARALKKLSNIGWKIGGLDLNLISCERLYFFLPNVYCSPTDFIQNLIDLSIYRSKITYARHKMVLSQDDKMCEWYMHSFDVNAYYIAELNEMVFPLGILQKPIFSDEYCDEYNYGSLGCIIAHELVHGFDNHGANFNEDGEMFEWWAESDKQQFERVKDKFIYFFSHIKVGEKYINGRLTCGENIADHTGMQVALTALKNSNRKSSKSMDMKHFFIAYAKTMCRYDLKKFQTYSLIMDPHSPSHIRVNANVLFCSEFYKAFKLNDYQKIFNIETSRNNINDTMKIY